MFLTAPAGSFVTVITYPPEFATHSSLCCVLTHFMEVSRNLEMLFLFFSFVFLIFCFIILYACKLSSNSKYKNCQDFQKDLFFITYVHHHKNTYCYISFRLGSLGKIRSGEKAPLIM